MFLQSGRIVEGNILLQENLGGSCSAATCARIAVEVAITTAMNGSRRKEMELVVSFGKMVGRVVERNGSEVILLLLLTRPSSLTE